jgi:DNA-binding CsgD family transcriptional regulator
MWIGRQRESAALEQAIREAKGGASCVLVISGEPGIGKTALLERAAGACDGARLLRARGHESESELPFAALGELLGPLLAQLNEIPAPQARALAVALALEPAGAGVDRLAVCAATLSLLAHAALARPLIALVDDAHWLDEGSAQALVFAARRLGSEGIALLVASQGGDAFERAGFPLLRLEGLDYEASLALLAQAPEPIAPAVAGRLADAAGGNPLALLELRALLTPTQRAGLESLDEPLAIGTALERAFGRALARTSDETRGALRIAAASGTGDARTILRAMALAGLGRDALEAGETVALVSIADGKVAFRHPLLRSVAYHSATPGERRHAHAALAKALSDASDAEEHAWQRAAAALEADENVARQLARAAERAHARGAPATAARAFERAARLTPDLERRAERLRDAALEMQLAGRPGCALELLEEAAALLPGPLLASEIAHLAGRVAIWLGPPLEAHERLRAAGRALEPGEPARAALVLAEAVFPAMIAAHIEQAIATAREANELGEGATLPALALAAALMAAGQEAEAKPLLDAHQRAIDTLDPLRDFEALHIAARTRMFCADHAGARRLLELVVGTARRAGAVGILPFPLVSLAELDFRSGRWPSALAQASEAVQLAAETGQATDVGRLSLAVIEAALGREADCRRHVAEGLSELARTGNEALSPWAGRALGLLALSHRRPEEARRQLEPVARFCAARRLLCLGAAQWEGDFIEACIHAGSREEAVAFLTEFENHARGAQHPGALAVVARCRGLLADTSGFDACFAEALRRHALAGDPFEHARTALAYGERLRRERRRREAVRHLEQALDAFDRLGARLWGARTHEELRSCGERVDVPRPSRLAELTPQELQVALVVARGATNREAGSELFLSEKTIETHLSRVYRKLAIRSRTELANVVLAADRPAS